MKLHAFPNFNVYYQMENGQVWKVQMSRRNSLKLKPKIKENYMQKTALFRYKKLLKI